MVRRFGDTVIVMGREDVVEADGRRLKRRYTNIWQQKPNGGAAQSRWRLIGRHAHIVTSE